MTPDEFDALTLDEQRIYDAGYQAGSQAVWERLMRDAIHELRGYGVTWDFVSAAKIEAMQEA